jgi:hypothetical protein
MDTFAFAIRIVALGMPFLAPFMWSRIEKAS